MKTKTLISEQWTRTTPIVISDPMRPTLRGTQQAAFDKLKDRKLMILNAPTGWGKSLVIVFLTLYKLLRNRKLRCVISIPQTVIARGFVGKDWILRVAGRLIELVCRDRPLPRRGQRIPLPDSSRFWKRRRRRSIGASFLCTHATLTQTYKRLKREYVACSLFETWSCGSTRATT